MASSSSRLVVITGGSSGIGRSAARVFVERGWRVALIARGEAALEDARADLAARGGTVSVFPADVADNAALRSAAAAGGGGNGPVRRVGEQRGRQRVRQVRGHDGGGVPPGHRRDLHGLRERHPRGAGAYAAGRCGHDRERVLRDRLPRRAGAVGVFGRQVGNARLRRGGAGRADQRGQPDPYRHGVSAGGQHAVLRPCRIAHRRAAPAPRRRSTSRRSWRTRSTSRPPPAA